MKRSPLHRKAPMKRRSPAGPRRRTKYARRERDIDYLGWVKCQPCAMAQMAEWLAGPRGTADDRLLWLWAGPCDFSGCRGPVEAHHAGNHGIGQKSDDPESIPLCQAHHRGDADGDIGITNLRGPFSGWPRGALKRWELAMVAVYQLRYAEHLAGRDAGIF